MVGWLQSASSTCLKPSQLMRGCYDEPGHWGSVALPIPYRVHVMDKDGNLSISEDIVSIPYRVHAMTFLSEEAQALFFELKAVSIPYRVHAMIHFAGTATCLYRFQFLIGFMQCVLIFHGW